MFSKPTKYHITFKSVIRSCHYDSHNIKTDVAIIVRATAERYNLLRYAFVWRGQHMVVRSPQ